MINQETLRIQFHKTRSIAILTGWIFYTLIRQAHPDGLRFERLPLEGISQSTVTAICQDSTGFLWFGTYNGLNRYDGFEYRIYKHEPNDPASLSHNNISSLIVDEEGALWIGTIGGGLNRFDAQDDRFERFRYDPENRAGLSHDGIRTMELDRAGGIWIGTWGGGLNRFDPETERFAWFTRGETGSGLMDNHIADLSEDRYGILWLATASGLVRFDPETERFTGYRHNPNNPRSLAADDVSAVCADPNGSIWVGTWTAGLDRLDPSTGIFSHYRQQSQSSGSVSLDAIRSLYVDPEGQLWVGTWGGGLNTYHRAEDRFVHYRHDPVDPATLSTDYIYDLFTDRTGVLWIGTDFNGINKLDPLRQPWHHRYKIPGETNGLNDNTIMAVEEDNEGIVWIGTRGGGLNRWDPKRDAWRHYRNDPGDPNSLSNDVIRSLCVAPSGDLWVGTEYGLNRFDPRKNRFTRYLPDPEKPGHISYHNVWSLFIDRSGELWAGTYEGGLNRLDRASGRFIHYAHQPKNPESLSDDFVWSICEDSRGALWIGTDNGGLNRLDRNTGRFVHYRHDPDDTTSLNDNKVLCQLVDRSGRLWIGTTSGLNRYDPATDAFVRYTASSGLPEQAIQGLIEDESGNLWMPTNNGLWTLNLETGLVTGYSKTHGLQGDEFSVNACCRLHNGWLIAGGFNGFNMFHPDSIRLDRHAPPVSVTAVQLLNPAIPRENEGHSMWRTLPAVGAQPLILSYKDQIIRFRFAALNYRSPGDNRYAYYLDGFRNSWYESGNQHEATYTNLNPGKYRFKVKAANRDGVWNEEGVSIPLIITPPFWRTLWFRIGAVLLFGALIFGLYRYRVRTIENHRRLLTRKVSERTAELKRSNDELAQFTYVAFHDLQEPIRIVSSYSTLLERTLGKALDADTREFLDFIRDSATRMQQLIEGLLQYTQVTTRAKPFEPTDCDRIIREILIRIRPGLEASDVKVTSDPLPTIRADSAQIRTVFTHLILNGLTYSRPGQPVRVHVSVEKSEEKWIFSVRDNGIGIDPEYWEKIFGIFKRLHTRDAYDGIGIGLPVSKKIVERHSGRLWMESAPGKGSTFYFSIPLEPPPVWNSEI